jgi:hypothetical protein
MLIHRVRPGLKLARCRAIEEENERYNPIRPSNGNMVIHGGSNGATSSRTPRLSMADSRAMEIQTRNETPGTGATPVMGVSQIRGGAGATPSMGLSEFRGGAMKDRWSVLAKKYFDEEYDKVFKGADYEDDEYDRLYELATKQAEKRATAETGYKPNASDRASWRPSGKVKRNIRGEPMYGMGMSNLQQLLDRTNVSRSGAYEGQGYPRIKSMPPVAMRGGKHYCAGYGLSEHLGGRMDKKSHKKMMEGMMKHAMELHGSGFFGDLWGKVKNEFVNPSSRLRGDVLPGAKKALAVAAPVLDIAGTYVGVPGVGTALSKGANTLEAINQGAKSVGLGKARRAKASPSDGRRKRAEIVRKVMNERGVSMIEASKIVKSEGLY